MAQKIAVAIIHGIGRADPLFADRLTNALLRRCEECADHIVFRPVHWSPVLQDVEDELWRRVNRGGELDYRRARRLMVDFFADAIAYQITPDDRYAYDRVHGVVAETLRDLARTAGPQAPLCIIAHSLGTIIASNYIYDLQTERVRPILPDTVRAEMGDTPLERGETFSLFYTMGSPLALWSMRYHEFGRPIRFPDPLAASYYPALRSEWINFYDDDDIVAYPLRTLNDAYNQVVTADMAINVGGPATSWTPLSHLEYWDDLSVIEPIAAGLRRAWQSVNA